jgi:hypothetical protein
MIKSLTLEQKQVVETNLEHLTMLVRLIAPSRVLDETDRDRLEALLAHLLEPILTALIGEG